MTFPFNDWLYDMLFFTSLVSIIGVSVLAYGYRASLVSEDRITRYFAASMVFLALGYALRRFSWDIVVPLYTGGVDYSPVNIIFNVINLIAVYFGLRARWLLIPEPERYAWKWYTAWMHPGLFRIRVNRIREGEDPR